MDFYSISHLFNLAAMTTIYYLHRTMLVRGQSLRIVAHGPGGTRTGHVMALQAVDPDGKTVEAEQFPDAVVPAHHCLTLLIFWLPGSPKTTCPCSQRRRRELRLSHRDFLQSCTFRISESQPVSGQPSLVMNSLWRKKTMESI